MSSEYTRAEQANYTRVLWIVLSALGVLALSIMAGILLFHPPVTATERQLALTQGQHNQLVQEENLSPDKNEKTETAIQEENLIPDNKQSTETAFEAIEKTRDSDSYPALEESQDKTTGEIVIAWPDEGGEAVVEKVVEKPREKQVVAEKSPVEKQVVAVSVKPVQEKAVQSVKSTVYWVQVASFPNSFKAEMLSNNLYSRGIPTTIQTQDVGGTTWYRIRVGAFSSREEADSFKIRLSSQAEMKDAFVVQGSMLKEFATSR